MAVRKLKLNENKSSFFKSNDLISDIKISVDETNFYEYVIGLVTDSISYSNLNCEIVDPRKPRYNNEVSMFLDDGHSFAWTKLTVTLDFNANYTNLILKCSLMSKPNINDIVIPINESDGTIIYPINELADFLENNINIKD